MTKLFADLEMKKKKLEERDAMERLGSWIYVYNHRKFSSMHHNFYEVIMSTTFASEFGSTNVIS